MTLRKIVSASAASAALLLTGFTPVLAAPMSPVVASVAPIETGSLGWNAESDKVQGWRNYRGYNSRRGYRGSRGYRRHRNRVDGGDILAGILIIGGIAAIASAASKNNRDRRYQDRDYRSDNRRYRDRRSDDRNSRSSRSSPSNRGADDMQTAISVCSNAAEQRAGRNARVSEIRSVTRDGQGWRVEGQLSNTENRTFQCGSTNGRVDFVQTGTGDLASAY